MGGEGPLLQASGRGLSEEGWGRVGAGAERWQFFLLSPRCPGGRRGAGQLPSAPLPLPFFQRLCPEEQEEWKEKEAAAAAEAEEEEGASLARARPPEPPSGSRCPGRALLDHAEPPLAAGPRRLAASPPRRLVASPPGCRGGRRPLRLQSRPQARLGSHRGAAAAGITLPGGKQHFFARGFANPALNPYRLAIRVLSTPPFTH